LERSRRNVVGHSWGTGKRERIRGRGRGSKVHGRAGSQEGSHRDGGEAPEKFSKKEQRSEGGT